MNSARSCFLAAVVVVGLDLAASAQAYEFRTQWVYRVGAGEPFDVVPASGFNAPSLGIAPGTAVRFQLQFGVFDDGASDAPAGGFGGWIDTLTASGGTNSRTPGRLPPYNFSPSVPGNGLPSTDPWTALTQINCTLGTQTRAWLGIDGTGDPGPPPPALVRGRNEFVSTYEITSVLGAADYMITASGSALAVLSWHLSAVLDTPDPGPDGIFGPPGSPEGADDHDGAVLYSPQSDFPGQPFASTLNIIVPGPASAALLGLAGLLAVRRRERSWHDHPAIATVTCGIVSADESRQRFSESD